MPKPRYKTTNWKQSNQDKRGRPRQFSDLAITTALMVKQVFSIPLRALQGFIDSVFSLAN
ncbi:IS5/IS1182 family transposase, partial [Vibrio parahaemolyticus]|uniref:transposase n=1 Tax=Vibrio parahaemolyticus TaxID=670 RepID=UPI00116F6BC6